MLIINAEKRVKKGKSFNRNLRNNNKFPGVLYGLKKNPILLILDHNTIFNLQTKNKFYKKNLILLIDEKKYEVKVKSIQKHLFKLKLLHIDFMYA